MSDSKIRQTSKADMPAIKAFIAETRLLPTWQVDAMVADYLAEKESAGQWVTCVDSGPAGIACYAPEPRSEGTWTLYLVVVRPDKQRNGIGTSLLEHVEKTLAAQGERILLVEISGYDQFQPTRNFCRKSGYHEEARIRDYFKPGEDKVIFRKNLIPD